MAMKFPTFGVLTVALCGFIVGAVEFDNNSFFVINNHYKQSRLTLHSHNGNKIAPYEGNYYEDQIWHMKPSGKGDGCYYMENGYRTSFRIANQNTGYVFPYNGNHYDDQLWKFVPGKDNAYYIVNCHYPDKRLANWRREKIIAYGGPKYEDQLWTFEPRLRAEIVTTTVTHIDNLQGPYDILIEISATEGFKKTSTASTKMNDRYKLSMEASIKAEIKNIKASTTISTEFEQTIEKFSPTTTETYWEKTKYRYTVPAHKNWKMMQHQIVLHSRLASDRAVIYAYHKIFTSDTDTFSDNTGWIVNS